MQLYDSIFKRKSTRKYLPDVLSEDQLSSIMEFVKGMKSLHPHIKTCIDLVDSSGTKGIVSAKSPHYLLLYSERKEGYLPNAGFLLQQADLYLSSLGLGSCWLGAAKTKAPAKDGLDYVIMLAFGTPADNPHRNSISEFKRKPLNEISVGSDDRLEAVRLAPSANNSQTWYFICNNDCIQMYRKKQNIIKAAMYNSMNQIDMGIALCHLWLASEKQGRPFWFKTEEKDLPPVDGYIWVGSIPGNP